MKNISLKHRLIIPIALLGIVAVLSNILSIINIRNVNMSAANIADNYMDGKSRLAEICQSSMNIHKMALSHIVATDYGTMTTLVGQIKEEEALLEEMLRGFEQYVTPQDRFGMRSSFSSVPAQATRHRMRTGLQTGTSPCMPMRWRRISMRWTHRSVSRQRRQGIIWPQHT